MHNSFSTSPAVRQSVQSRLSPMPDPNGRATIVEVIYPGTVYKYYRQAYKKYFHTENNIMSQFDFVRCINDGYSVTVGNVTYAKKNYPPVKIP